MEEYTEDTQSSEYIEHIDEDMKEVMKESIGATQLEEYIEQDNEGGYCKLMGWPAQTDLSVKTNRANLEEWYPNTAPAPAAPSALQWRPYKIVKTVPHECRPKPDPFQGPDPFRGTLKYNKDLGWHYKYAMPFKIIGRPLLSSMKSKNPGESIPSITMAQLCLWPQPKIERKAFIRLKRIKVKVTEVSPNIGLPEVRLKRIEQQPGFRSLKILLEKLN
jgi:hypothetical protein